MRTSLYSMQMIAFISLTGCQSPYVKYQMPSFVNNGILGRPVPPMECVMPMFTDVDGDGLEDILVPRHEGVKCLLNTGQIGDREFVDFGIIPGTEKYGNLPIAPMGEKIGDEERFGFLIYTTEGVRYFRNIGLKNN